jgi:quercetin dioxygenase-like cupin family protein
MRENHRTTLTDSTLTLPFLLLAPTDAGAQAGTTPDSAVMRISRAERPVQPGPAAYFTGTVQVTPLVDARPSSRDSGASVTFEPGARSALHRHPFGQRLIGTAGTGRVQPHGGPVEEIREGVGAWFAPGEKHWHGASSESAMTHIAIQKALDDLAVERRAIKSLLTV